VQQPYPRIFMSGSSPESGEFAAKNRVGLGLAFTNVPQAQKSVEHYRKHAEAAGWKPTNDDIIYRVITHVGETDEDAIHAYSNLAKIAPRGSLTLANRNLESAVDSSGYYGKDRDSQRARLMPRSMQESIEIGSMVIGSPETVCKQIERIHRELGAGIIDMTVANDLGEKTLRSIELIGEKVIPFMRTLGTA